MRINGRPGGDGLEGCTLELDIEAYEKVPMVKAAQVNEPVEVDTAFGLVQASPGDRLVELPDGSLRVYDSRTFVASYRPIKKRASSSSSKRGS